MDCLNCTELISFVSDVLCTRPPTLLAAHGLKQTAGGSFICCSCFGTDTAHDARRTFSFSSAFSGSSHLNCLPGSTVDPHSNCRGAGTSIPSCRCQLIRRNSSCCNQRTHSDFLHDQLFSAPPEPWALGVAPTTDMSTTLSRTALV